MNEKLEVILKSLQESQKAFADLFKEMTAKLAEATKLKDQYQAQLKHLEDREKAIESKERFIRTAEQIDTEQNKLLEGIAEFENRKKLFERECSERRAVLDQKEADFVSYAKSIQDKEKALEKEKETYKQDLLRRIKAVQKEEEAKRAANSSILP